MWTVCLWWPWFRNRPCCSHPWDEQQYQSLHQGSPSSHTFCSSFSLPSPDSFWPWFTSWILTPTCRLIEPWLVLIPRELPDAQDWGYAWGLDALLLPGALDRPLWSLSVSPTSILLTGSPSPLDEKNRHITNVQFYLNLFCTFSGDPCRKCSLWPGLEVFHLV